MNPNSGSGGENQPQQHSFELPPDPAGNAIEHQSERPSEKETASESAAGKQQPPPQLPVIPQAAPPADPLQVMQPTAQPTSGPPTATSDLAAQDIDLIEKPWVGRTKKVIEATKNDPFKQKNEVSRIKADYIKKRYKKVIQVSGSADAMSNEPRGDAVTT